MTVGRCYAVVSLMMFVGAVGVRTASAQAPSPLPAPVFDIAVRIHTGDPALEVEGQVTVPARPQMVASIELRFDGRLRDLDLSVVSPSVSTGATTVTTTSNTATVTLGVPAPAGSPVVLKFRYRIGATSNRSFYVAADGALLSGESFRWYPLPSPYRRATGRLRFIVAEGVTVAATGRRSTSRDADGAVRFEVTDPTTFSFAAGRHEVYTSPGDPAIALHLLKPRSRAADRLVLIRRILNVLVDEFGRYPHPDLEVVEMPVGAMGGTDNGTSLEGFIAVGSDIIERASLPTLAHEISHQWWADCVFGVGPFPALLTESMSDYGALRAIEGIHGERAAALARWRGYPGDSLFAGGRGYLSLVRAGLDGALTSPTGDLVRASKGQLVHDLLSRTMGRERFRNVLRSFVRDHAFQDTTWQTFVDAVRAADPDIAWFFEQWYARPGAPSWTVSWTETAGEVRGVIAQSAPYFRADVDVVLLGSQTREVRQLRIDGPRTEFAWRAGFSIAAVEVDPDYKVLHDSADRATDVEAIAPLGQAAKAMREGSSFTIAAVDALRDRPDQPGREFLREVLLADDTFKRQEWDAARAHVDAAVASRAPLPEVLPGLFYTQALLAQMRGDTATLERAARAALDADDALAAPSGWGLAARELIEDANR